MKIPDWAKNPDGSLRTLFWLVGKDGKTKILSGTFNDWPQGYDSTTGGAVYSEEQLRQNQCIPDEPCRECGQIFGANYIEPIKSEMLAANICHSCHFWRGYCQEPSGIRIGGKHYMDCGPKGGDMRFNGFGGQRFIIRMHSGREIITNNLWYQGDIPPHFRDRLPDNAEWKKEQP